MNRRDIVIGLLFLIILSGVVIWRARINSKNKEELIVPQTLSVEDQLEERFNLKIPEDVDKVELKDVTGGTASGIATRKFENGKFELSILSDLSDPTEGKFYQAWLVKGNEGEEGYTTVSLGKLILAKGGWILNYNSKTDYRENGRVLVSLEKVLDKNLEAKVLDGKF